MVSKAEINPETIKRWQDAFNANARGGKLEITAILPALEEAKENYNEADVSDALDVMQIQNQPLDVNQFIDLIGILKDPETVVEAFNFFDKENKGAIEEDEFRSMVRKHAPGLTGKEIEEILEKAQATNNGKLGYKNFVQYWSNQ